MFKKLISNLPFNPSLISSVAFYAKRMHQETSVRRLGFIFVMLAVMVQVFAIISPAQPSSAVPSDNDLIRGGVVSISDATSKCWDNVQGYRAILYTLAATCDNVAAGSVISLRSTDQGGQLYSSGHNHYFADDFPFEVDGVGTILFRPLHEWDTGAYSTYTAISFRNTAGKQMYILFDCGNIVTVGLPQHPQPAPTPTPTPVPPHLTISKSTPPGNAPLNGSNVKPGTQLGYRITFSNTGGPATGVTVSDQVPAHTHVIWVGGGPFQTVPSITQNPIVWKLSGALGKSTYYTDFTVQVDDNTPNGTNICNTASIKSDQTGSITSNQVCHHVLVSAPVKPPVVIPPIQKPCQQSLNNNDILSCLALSKTARNNTQNIKDADGTTAQPGDSITYTLSVRNSANVTFKQFTIQENMSDVLVYADITDLHGGRRDQGTVFWPATDIGAGQTASRQITIKVKNPIPETPFAPNDPMLFDLMMTNYYGNFIHIKLPGTLAKVTEVTTTTTLPNTGPGTTLTIGFTLTAIVGYFFARSRLMAKELVMIKNDYTSTGGV